MILFRSFVLIAVLLLAGLVGRGQVGTGKIRGTVTDSASGEAVPFVNVTASQNGKTISGAATDFYGTYTISSLPPGDYSIDIFSNGYNCCFSFKTTVKRDSVSTLNMRFVKGTLVEVQDSKPISRMGCRSMVRTPKELRKINRAIKQQERKSTRN